MADVVVVFPGIAGSVPRHGQGRDVWRPSVRAPERALVTLGRSLTDPERRNENADDGVTAPLVVPDLHLIPGLWKIDGYSKLSAYLQKKFTVTWGKNFFEFPHDTLSQAARQTCDDAADPTWLAYIHYADPTATVSTTPTLSL